MKLRSVSLDDKYDLLQPRLFLTGYQAVIRMCLMQKERDRRAGLNTAGFVTGYRGSPLGGLDQQFARAARHLEAQNIRFQAGINEELAATAIWGSQQAELRGEGKFDGVFGIWYGKGPGVDRSGDVFRHANFAGSSEHGGVLALAGDDHTAQSSTTAHQSDYHFVDLMMPILNPANVQEIIDYGLYGIAMSRFSGSWVSLKCLHETIESTGIVDGSLDRVKITLPTDFIMPDGGLNIRLNDPVREQEARLYDFKRDAMLEFIRVNRLNRTITSGGRRPKIGIITTGKSYLDVRQALDELGVDEVKCNALGIRLLKIGCPWPIGGKELVEFAAGLELIIVVEEKRSLIEVQVREELYGTANQPVCIGKKDELGDWLFPAKGALDPNDIAIVIGERILACVPDEEIVRRLSRLKHDQHALSELQEIAIRVPYFCSGCPHSTSTAVPEGMRAYAGIGCHYMAQWMERSTEGFTQMGGEGANWIGEAPFSKRPHVFQNLGDGTYNHSGYLAIRAAAAARINITYKILYNDAVAMTGGQANEGGLDVPQIARQVAAEGAKRIVVVTDEPHKYPNTTDWPRDTTIRHRDDLEPVQRELAAIPGLTILIYDQTCAAEKRRRRKRGTYPDPQTNVVINEMVCEGCGDCGVKSNCVSLQPLETEWGRKRRIDQSSCNKDYSCLKGFCPSFVTVHGAKRKRGTSVSEDGLLSKFPEPNIPPIDVPFGIIVTGIGGTGIVTVGAVLGMAAHLEGKGVGIVDMAGLAQKGGAVYSFIRIANRQEDIHAIPIAAGGADLVLGGDIVVASNKRVLAAVKGGRALFVANTAESFPGDFARQADFSLPIERLRRAITSAAGPENTSFVDASQLAVALLGNSIGANMLLVGFAYQKGGLPLSAMAIEKAIEMNGEAIAMNLAAFRWGRRAAIDLAAVEAFVKPRSAEENRCASESFDEMVERRVAFLTDYQNSAYAQHYRAQVIRVQEAEARLVPGKKGLAEAVARYLFKLMAYKDEYEVARLYTDGNFRKQLASEFEGGRLEFHLAPPFLARRNPTTGEPRKMSFGPWMMMLFRLLARLKRLRGTPCDPFGYSNERRAERRLIAEYETLLDEILPALKQHNHHLAVALSNIPEKIRGFGPVKYRHLQAAKASEAALLDRFRSSLGFDDQATPKDAAVTITSLRISNGCIEREAS